MVLTVTYFSTNNKQKCLDELWILSTPYQYRVHDFFTSFYFIIHYPIHKRSIVAKKNFFAYDYNNNNNDKKYSNFKAMSLLVIIDLRIGLTITHLEVP